MAIKYVSRDDYKEHMEYMLQKYEDAGLTPADCMTDFSNGKGEVCYADGYADGALVGGIALTIAGLICKFLAKKEPKNQARQVNNKLAYYSSIKPLTDFKVPTGDEENREENTN